MKQIVLTGAAGGLGTAVALYLASHDCRVFACDIKPSPHTHPHIVPVHMDVRSQTSVSQAYETVQKSTNRLDAVISLAGVYMMDSLVEMEEARFTAILDINLTGVYRVNKTFLPMLRDGGRILITTSELAWQKPLPFNGIYSLTKTALDCYADSLRLELMLLGIPVITIRPGPFQTQLVNTSGKEMMRLCEKTTLYQIGAQRFRAIMDSQTQTAKDPSVLAAVIYKALTSRRPRYVYTKNAGFLLKLYSALPRRLQALALKQLLK